MANMPNRPGCGGQPSDPGLEDAVEELERVASRDDEEAERERDAGVEEKPHDHRQHVHAQRHGRLAQVVDAQNLAGDQTHQAERRVPAAARQKVPVSAFLLLVK